jgi:hydrogenase-1 operon protein HyaF
MNGLNGIGVKVVHVGGNGNAHAVLREIESRLQLLLEKGEEGSIDLSGLPLMPEDYDLLEETLGEGEVVAEVHSLGPTRIHETGIPGVWWVTHYNSDDEVLAEFIEVAWCPEILLTPEDDVKDGLEALRARLFELNPKSPLGGAPSLDL